MRNTRARAACGVSPLYSRLKAQGAVFGSKLGWERPNWFASNGDEPYDIYSFGRQNWFDSVGREHKACRERRRSSIRARSPNS